MKIGGLDRHPVRFVVMADERVWWEDYSIYYYFNMICFFLFGMEFFETKKSKLIYDDQD